MDQFAYDFYQKMGLVEVSLEEVNNPDPYWSGTFSHIPFVFASSEEIIHIAKIFALVYLEDSPDNSKDKYKTKIKNGISFLAQNPAEALLSEQPLIREIASFIYNNKDKKWSDTQQ
jgi:hypothetical protein